MNDHLIGGPADGKQIPDYIPADAGGQVVVTPCDVPGVVYLYKAGPDGRFRYVETRDVPDRWNWTRYFNEPD
jgi:hypothetical protein